MPTTVFAVVKVMIEIPVRTSSPDETLAQLQEVAKKEADRILQSKLPPEFRIVGQSVFSHAMVRTD